jgi:hypothetical protein
MKFLTNYSQVREAALIAISRPDKSFNTARASPPVLWSALTIERSFISIAFL